MQTILSNMVFLWAKLIIALANLFLHWQIYFYTGKSMFAWVILLLHGKIYYCIGKSVCMGNFIIAWANLFCMGIIILHGQYSREIIAYATKDSFQNLERNLLFSCAKFRSGSSRLLRRWDPLLNYASASVNGTVPMRV